MSDHVMNMVNECQADMGLLPTGGSSVPVSIDDIPESVPAAGYRNGTSLNNAGSNGNYWSSSPNTSNSNNAYNLNFNSSNFDWNNNNRYNGQSVRPVSALAKETTVACSAPCFKTTKEQLLLDLYRAYRDARVHKRGKDYQIKFEMSLEDNLVRLRDDLYNGTYQPLPSTVFIIHEPKMREVFAAHFRDRIVHHLFYNYTHHLFERTFIHDSYSCIKGRGTHFGIERLKHHINSVSQGYSQPCYVMKIDIKGYFMTIDRSILLRLCRHTLRRYQKELADPMFVDYLLEGIINANPTSNCRVLGDKSEWESLPTGKSLFTAPEGCGLPIGNLSSQLFSNIYMNCLDQFVKRELHCQHYGRYVDDAYFVATDKDTLRCYLPQIREFLQARLGLTLNENKTQTIDALYGVEFLGAFIKPFRSYPSSRSLRRIRKKLHHLLPSRDPKQLQAKVNSMLGVMSHHNCYCLRRVMFGHEAGLDMRGRFNSGYTKFSPNVRVPFLPNML